MEPETKKWKKGGKQNIKMDICSEVLANNMVNPRSQSWLCGKDLQKKEGFKPGLKEWRGDG